MEALHPQTSCVQRDSTMKPASMQPRDASVQGNSVDASAAEKAAGTSRSKMDVVMDEHLRLHERAVRASGDDGAMGQWREFIAGAVTPVRLAAYNDGSNALRSGPPLAAELGG